MNGRACDVGGLRKSRITDPRNRHEFLAALLDRAHDAFVVAFRGSGVRQSVQSYHEAGIRWSIRRFEVVAFREIAANGHAIVAICSVRRSFRLLYGAERVLEEFYGLGFAEDFTSRCSRVNQIGRA